MLGVKTKTFTTKNEYSLEALLEAMQKRTFTAGVPELTKHGPAFLITFPALDLKNQVQIIKFGFGKTAKKFSVQKSEQAGTQGAVKNLVMDTLTDGFFSLGGMTGSISKQCEELVEITAKELAELDL